MLFDYRIVARRKGYENVRLTDATKAHTHSLELAQRSVSVKPQRANSSGPARTLGRALRPYR